MLPQIISQSRHRFDSDARLWINAVEAADAQALEYGVKHAMNSLVVDLKANSLWSLISSMTVKMAARTLAGALIDIKTPASSWTNFNFVSGDYNRTTGLIGNGTTKYLNTNRNNNAEAQNDQSIWTFVSSIASTNAMAYIAGGIPAESGASGFTRNSAGNINFTSRNSTAVIDTGANAIGLIGLSRSIAGSFVSRGNGANQNTNISTSETPLSANIYDHAANFSSTGVAQDFSDHRSRASCIGQAMTLATADTVFAAFVTKITALSL